MHTTAVMAGPDEDFHLWGAITATGRIDSNNTYRYWLEGQGRFNDDGSRFNQGILRTAIGRRLTEQARGWLGYAWIPDDPINNPNDFHEHRVFQQLTYNSTTPWTAAEFASRTRLEQRIRSNGDDLGVRFRQFVKLSINAFVSETIYLSLWDEVFINFNDTDWGQDTGLDQNRLFFGLGVELDENTKTEIGYLQQYVPRDNRRDALNHILSVSLFLNF